MNNADDKKATDDTSNELTGLLGVFHLATLSALYDHGDRGLLLLIISHCLMHKIDVPERFAIAFSESVHKFFTFQVSSLDEAFRVSQQSAHRASKEKKGKKMREVYFLSNKLHKGDSKKYPFEPDGLLFQTVGSKFHISSSLARKYYYEFKSLDENLLAFQKSIVRAIENN